jgi:hypothetical protein
VIPLKAFVIAAGLSPLLGAGPALAGQQIYVYAVLHPSYGRIGTLTDTVDRSPDAMRIDQRLRVAVELLGVVVYRQQSDITEIMRGDRLVSLDSVTDRNKRHTEVHGKALGDQFVVDATLGSFTGPATTSPSDPWALGNIGLHTLVYTSSGRINDAEVSGGQNEKISLNGGAVSLRHFVVTGLNRQEVWVDSGGIPVLFRSFEDGTPIDFVLEEALEPGGADPLLPAKSAIQVGSGKN